MEEQGEASENTTPSNWKVQFITVTSFSKWMALIMFVVLPFAGFYTGVKYQREINPPFVVEEYEPIDTITQENIPETMQDNFVSDRNVFSTTSQTMSAAEVGDPSIEIVFPVEGSVYSKALDSEIPVSWVAKNVPENTEVRIELKAVQLFAGFISGGVWGEEIGPGNNSGNHDWIIAGEGRTDPGVFNIRVSLKECLPEGCHLNSDSPGSKPVELYATSSWRQVTIEDDTDVSVTLQQIEPALSAEAVNPESSLTFMYYPKGKITTCTGYGIYEGGIESAEHPWYESVEDEAKGKFSFSAVGMYPNLGLEYVRVICKNNIETSVDQIRVAVDHGEPLGYKILTGLEGEKVFAEDILGTRVEAISFCMRAYNDVSVHNNTRVQCYFDSIKFEDVKAFKG